MIDGLISIKDNFVINENKDYVVSDNSNINVVKTNANIYDFTNNKNINKEQYKAKIIFA